MPIQAPSWTDFLICPICCNEYSVDYRCPLSLGCGHTICRLCLKTIHNRLCPFDQGVIHTDIDHLPINYAILQLVSTYKQAPGHENDDIAWELKWHSASVHALHPVDLKWYRSASESIEKLALHLRPLVNSGNFAGPLSRPMQRKLVTLINCQLIEEEGRVRAIRAARSLGERSVTELILQHQNPQQLSSNLWAAVRSRGCQFLGPAMQEDVLRLVLIALEKGEAFSRKVLVMYVVQKLEKKFPQASKTSIGHVVQLLYRASCFKVSKRESDSSLMQLKEEFRTYDALRREHDAQIVQIATEAGLRIAPDQWSTLLYGDNGHKSHMQSIIDKLQTPSSFAQSVQELFMALQRTGDPTNLSSLRTPLTCLSSIDISSEAASPSWQILSDAVFSVSRVIEKLVEFVLVHSTRKDLTQQQNHTLKYKISLCRDLTVRRICPRGNNCTFAHSEEELERYRTKNRKPLRAGTSANLLGNAAAVAGVTNATNGNGPHNIAPAVNGSANANANVTASTSAAARVREEISVATPQVSVASTVSPVRNDKRQPQRNRDDSASPHQAHIQSQTPQPSTHSSLMTHSAPIASGHHLLRPPRQSPPIQPPVNGRSIANNPAVSPPASIPNVAAASMHHQRCYDAAPPYAAMNYAASQSASSSSPIAATIANPSNTGGISGGSGSVSGGPMPMPRPFPPTLAPSVLPHLLNAASTNPAKFQRGPNSAAAAAAAAAVNGPLNTVYDFMEMYGVGLMNSPSRPALPFYGNLGGNNGNAALDYANLLSGAKFRATANCAAWEHQQQRHQQKLMHHHHQQQQAMNDLIGAASNVQAVCPSVEPTFYYRKEGANNTMDMPKTTAAGGPVVSAAAAAALALNEARMAAVAYNGHSSSPGGGVDGPDITKEAIMAHNDQQSQSAAAAVWNSSSDSGSIDSQQDAAGRRSAVGGGLNDQESDQRAFTRSDSIIDDNSCPFDGPSTTGAAVSTSASLANKYGPICPNYKGGVPAPGDNSMDTWPRAPGNAQSGTTIADDLNYLIFANNIDYDLASELRRQLHISAQSGRMTAEQYINIEAAISHLDDMRYHNNNNNAYSGCGMGFGGVGMGGAAAATTATTATAGSGYGYVPLHLIGGLDGNDNNIDIIKKNGRLDNDTWNAVAAVPSAGQTERTKSCDSLWNGNGTAETHAQSNDTVPMAVAATSAASTTAAAAAATSSATQTTATTTIAAGTIINQHNEQNHQQRIHNQQQQSHQIRKQQSTYPQQHQQQNQINFQRLNYQQHLQHQQQQHQQINNQHQQINNQHQQLNNQLNNQFGFNHLHHHHHHQINNQHSLKKHLIDNFIHPGEERFDIGIDCGRMRDIEQELAEIVDKDWSGAEDSGVKLD